MTKNRLLEQTTDLWNKWHLWSKALCEGEGMLNKIKPKITIKVCDNCDSSPKIVGYHYYNEKCPKCGGNAKIYLIEMVINA